VRRPILVGGALIVLALFVGAVMWRAMTPWSPGSISRKDRSDILAIEYACERYALEHEGEYPSDITDLLARVPGRRPYLAVATLPLDPWGRPYRFEPPAAEFEFARIWTFGRDGLPGGVGDDTDVGNWMWRD